MDDPKGCIIEDVEFVGGDLSRDRGGGGLAAVGNDDICSLECEKRSGYDFTNVLRAAFTLVDPESVKKYS
jgi:hypothetical protein